MMCSLVAKTFELAALFEDDMQAIAAVSFANAILENIKDVGPAILPGILDMYLAQMQSVDSPDLYVMLLQGFMVAFWYDLPTALSHLEQRQATAHVVGRTIKFAGELEQDFEVKKFMLGMSALLVSPKQMQLPHVITDNTQNFMKALAYLAKKSIEIT